MGIFGRMWRMIKGWLLIGVEKAEDPEVILAEAQDSMRRELGKVQENAVQAIAARNQLRGVLQDQVNQAAELEAKARAALKAGDEELARQLLVEKGTYETNIEALKAQLDNAEKAAEAVKQGYRSMEMQVRQSTAKRLALVAGWKQAKIQEQLNKALSGVSMEGPAQAFQQAEERIKALQSKADARIELAQGGLQQKIAKLENVVANDRADQALAAMKQDMGLLPANTQQEDGRVLLSLPLGGEGRTINAGSRENTVAVTFPERAENAADAVYVFVHEIALNVAATAVRDNITPAEQRSGVGDRYTAAASVRAGYLVLEKEAPDLADGYARFYLRAAGVTPGADPRAQLAATFPLPQAIREALERQVDVILGGI
jgi:phage shock protein A